MFFLGFSQVFPGFSKALRPPSTGRTSESFIADLSRTGQWISSRKSYTPYSANRLFGAKWGNHILCIPHFFFLPNRTQTPPK